MNIQPIKLNIIILLSLFFVYIPHLYAQDNNYDPELQRLESKLIELSGKEKLDTLSYLIDYATYRNPGKILHFINEFEAEAEKQNNIKAQSYAKAKKVEMYFYQFDTDSVFMAAAIAEEFARTHKHNDRLHIVQQIVIQRYAVQGEYAKAARKGQELLRDAKDTGDYYGMALASAGIGNTYNTMGMTEDALKYFKEGLSYLYGTDYNNSAYMGLYLDLYYMICHTYYTLSDYDNMLLYTDSLHMKMNECKLKNISIDLLSFHFLVEKFYAEGALEEKDMEKAYHHIQKADSIHNFFENPSLTYSLNSLKANYYMHLDEHKTSMKYFEDAISFVKENELNDFQSFRHYTDYAGILFGLEQYKEASFFYKEASDRMKENYETDLHTQINQLRTLYDLDKLELQTEKDKLQLSIVHNRLIAFTIVTILLLFIIVIVIYNMRRIHKKNISLVQRIRKQDLLEEEMNRKQEELDKLRIFRDANEPETSLQKYPSHEEVLIRKLKNLLKENPVYTNPTINRKSLAEILGTNENYLRTAIKNQLGYTFNEYMNELRLNHVKKILASDPESTIEEIAIASGFNTRSTLYRKFRDKYEVTPEEYRKLIKRML